MQTHKETPLWIPVAVFTALVLFLGWSVDAAEYTATPGNISAKVNALQSGDVLILQGRGTYQCDPFTINGKTDVTIVASELWQNHKLVENVVLATGNPFTKTFITPQTIIEFPSTKRAITLEKAHRFALFGVHIKGGGIRPQNTDNWNIQNVAVSDSRYGGMELDGYTPDNGEGGLAHRAKGGILRHFVAFHNACTGINFSWQDGIHFYDIYSVNNNFGVDYDPAPGFTSRAADGKWYANVQNAGGGGKYSGLSNLVGEWYAAWDNVGIGQWYDWLNDNCTITNIVCVDARWKQFSYDATNIQEEISGPGIKYVNGYVRGGDAGTNICESNGTTIENFDYVGQGANHRNLGDGGGLRNGGVYNILYKGTRFIQGGGYGWWGNMGTQYRVDKNINIADTNYNATARYNADWWQPNGPQQPTIPPVTQPTTQPTEPPVTGTESADGTILVASPGHVVGTIQLANGDRFAISIDQKAVRNGVVQTGTNGIEKLVYKNHIIHQTAHGLWWKWTGSNWTLTSAPEMGTPPATQPTTQPAPTATTTEHSFPIDFTIMGKNFSFNVVVKVTATGARTVELTR